jgi:phenylpyruvate tautomerase PptA (4-oxalocrotonate tautomerase family)
MPIVQITPDECRDAALIKDVTRSLQQPLGAACAVTVIDAATPGRLKP